MVAALFFGATSIRRPSPLTSAVMSCWLANRLANEMQKSLQIGNVRVGLESRYPSSADRGFKSLPLRSTKRCAGQRRTASSMRRSQRPRHPVHVSPRTSRGIDQLAVVHGVPLGRTRMPVPPPEAMDLRKATVAWHLPSRHVCRRGVASCRVIGVSARSRLSVATITHR